MNKKKKVVNISIYPEARKASGLLLPGRQNRPDSQPKKNRTFPPGNALLYIQTVNDFFQTRRTFRGAPFFLSSNAASERVAVSRSNF